MGVCSFSFSFSVAFRLRFWGREYELVIELAIASSFRRSLSLVREECIGTSPMSCWLRSGMKMRKSARRSGASLKSLAICLETSS